MLVMQPAFSGPSGSDIAAFLQKVFAAALEMEQFALQIPFHNTNQSHRVKMFLVCSNGEKNLERERASSDFRHKPIILSLSME